MGLVEYLRVLSRFWLIVAGSVVIAVTIGVLTGSVSTPAQPVPSYQATAYLLNSNAGTQAAQTSLSDPETIADLTTIAPIPERVADRIGFEGDPETLVLRVSVVPQVDTGFVTITATSADPEDAEALANAFALELLDRLVELKEVESEQKVQDLNGQISGLERDLEDAEGPEETALQAEIVRLRSALRAARLDPVPGFTLVTPPTAQLVSTDGFQGPRSFAGRALIAAAVGLIFGVGVALVLGQFDTRIHTKESAEESFGVPVLMEIPVLSFRDRQAIVTEGRPTSVPALAFQLLAAEVVRGVSANGSRPISAEGGKTVLVTSAGPGEGKTTVVANLAVALADMSNSVVALSCDFRRPKLHTLFGAPEEEGLADAIRSANGGPVLNGLVQKTSVDGVVLVQSGVLTESPGRLLRSEKMARAMEEARGEGDIVLVDTPPVLVASDAILLLPRVDAVLVVARVGKTSALHAERTMELLRRMQAPVLGVILNRVANVSSPRGHRRYHRPESKSEGIPDLARPSEDG